MSLTSLTRRIGAKVKKINKKLAAGLFSGLMATSLVTAAVPQASAATVNPAAQARISFTFDDGLASALSTAAPTLSKYGYTGTDYIITNCVGMTKAPNTCPADEDMTYMSWAQITSLQNTYKWEIGSHTVDHPLSSTLTDAQIENEMVQSKTALAAHGFNAQSVATPYGDYDNRVLASIARNYTSHRGFFDTGYNSWPNNDYILKVQQVQAGVSVATVKGYIDSAIQNKQWLVLVFHEVRTKPSTDPEDYQYSTTNLDQIASYAKSKKIVGSNISAGLTTSTMSMLPNDTFNSGIGGGWTTDDAASIKADSGDHGSFPDSRNSVAFNVTGKTAHLFSPKVAIDPARSYVSKNFVNVSAVSGGASLGFYIDEYDVNGNWISGQYKREENTAFVEDFNFEYKPTSTNVKQASLQVFAAANAGSVSAYLDNTKLFPETGSVPTNPTPAPTPTPSLTPTPVPTAVNLMPNGTFDDSLGDGWRADNSGIAADHDNNGAPANPVNSMLMVAPQTSGNIHLFSPVVAIDSSKSFAVAAYLNIKSLTSGVVAVYVDEYDGNGNWISGQYKTDTNKVGVTAVGFTYNPTNANVKKVSLQFIVVGNSGIDVYVDNVQLVQL